MALRAIGIGAIVAGLVAFVVSAILWSALPSLRGTSPFWVLTSGWIWGLPLAIAGLVLVWFAWKKKI